METPKPANGWRIKQPLDGTWAAMPADASHPDYDELTKLQPSLVLACDYTYLVGPLSDQPGILEDHDKRSRAAQLIEHATKRGYNPEQTATLLDKFELLAPDLPESNGSDGFVPGGKEWLPGGPYGPIVWTAPNSTIMAQRIEPGDLTPDEARGIAYALLAAANHAEGEA